MFSGPDISQTIGDGSSKLQPINRPLSYEDRRSPHWGLLVNSESGQQCGLSLSSNTSMTPLPQFTWRLMIIT